MISSVELRGEIRKQMYIRDWTYADLAKVVGYTQSTVATYMSDAPKQSEIFERSVCHALGIKSV